MTNPNLRDRDNYAREQYTREVIRENQEIRENDSAATGLVIGILLAGLTALGVAAYYLTQRPTTTTAPTRTIIERTKEVPVQQPKAPDVNITVPNPAPPDVNITVPNPPASSNQTAPSNSTAPSGSSAPTTTAPSGSTAPSNSTAPSDSTAPTTTAPSNP